MHWRPVHVNAKGMPSGSKWPPRRKHPAPAAAKQPLPGRSVVKWASQALAAPETGTSSVAFEGVRLHLKCVARRNRRFIVSLCALPAFISLQWPAH